MKTFKDAIDIENTLEYLESFRPYDLDDFAKKFIDYRLKFFNPKNTLNKIIEDANKFLLANNIQHIIVGVSGGIDSAVTYKILKIIETINCKLTIHPVIIPIVDSTGSTEQEEAYKLAKLVVAEDSNLIVPHIASVSAASNLLFNSLPGCSHTNKHFQKGQLDYWIRPLLFYTITSQYENSIVCGTINKSELITGFFGKKTDTCDLQLLTHLYKSEVFALAKHLEIPELIIKAIPKGNVFSGATDEQLLNMSYDIIQLIDYLLTNCDAADFKKLKITSYLKGQLVELWENFEALKQITAHKHGIYYCV